MGYLSSGNTVQLIAKLTPTGRKKLIETENNLITSFSLGDSDANYNSTYLLTPGTVPSATGFLGPNSTVSNSVFNDVDLRSRLIVDTQGSFRKTIQSTSSGVTVEYNSIGYQTVSGTNVTYNTINRDDSNTNSLVNLFKSFNLPLDQYSFYLYTGSTYAFGGFSDTSLSGFVANKIVAVGINNATYGEIIDGKTIKLDVTLTGTGITIYSTFISNSFSTAEQLDTQFRETVSNIDNNIVYLVSDEIMRPNGGDSNLSWSTGYGLTRPFSKNRKRLINLVTDTNVAQTADTVVGIAYLNKGFFVFTHPFIVNNFDELTGLVNATFDSISTSVVQNITCIADRGEFTTSTNTTISSSDIPRITELGLYDEDGDLIAYSKFDRQILKEPNDFLAFSVKLIL